jgi:hypothetical protein
MTARYGTAESRALSKREILVNNAGKELALTNGRD